LIDQLAETLTDVWRRVALPLEGCVIDAAEGTTSCRKPYEVGHSTTPPALLTSEERDRLEAVL
jgi:hypothetical protein